MLGLAEIKETNDSSWIHKVPVYLIELGLKATSFCFRHGFQRALYYLMVSFATGILKRELSKEECTHYLKWSTSLYRYHGTKSSFFCYFDATLSVQMKNYTQAISILEDLVESEKKANYYLLLALCYKELNHQTETLKALKNAYLASQTLGQEEKEELFKLYQELLLTVPLKVIQKEAIELSRIETEETRTQKGLKDKEKIEKLIKNKAYQSALQLLLTVAKKEPNEADWLYQIAYCYFALKENDLSKKYLEAALTIKEDKNYFHLMYRILLKKRVYSSALHYLDRALELEPDNKELIHQKCWFKWHYSRKLPQA